MTALPLIALVGRPNVGKSSLFNILTRSRKALVDDTPGLTRDRQYGHVAWTGFPYRVIDTGGFLADSGESIAEAIRTQAMVAIEEADLIILVTDGIAGVMPDDRYIADLLRRSGKPAICAVNKTEGRLGDATSHEFHALGLNALETIAAIHKQGIEELLLTATHLLGIDRHIQTQHVDPKPEGPIRVAVIGCPNAGKSSLINRLLGEERQIISPVAGTTRDSIDLPWTDPQGNNYLFIDTAGIRRKNRTTLRVEKYSVIAALKAIDQAEVAVLVLDAERGITDQDQRVAEYAINAGCGLILAMNKWDLVTGGDAAIKAYYAYLAVAFPRLAHVPSLFLSALTGKNLKRLLPAVRQSWDAAGRRIGTAAINRWLIEATTQRPHPRVLNGLLVKFRYATQVAIRPPTLAIFTNRPDEIQVSYQRYLENRLREAFNFAGAPIRIVFRKTNNPYVTATTGTTSTKRPANTGHRRSPATCATSHGKRSCR